MEEQAQPVDTRTDYEKARDEMMSAGAKDAKGNPIPCHCTFGQCGPVGRRSFGQGSKSDTPHICCCGKNHDSKLHICGMCGDIGAIVEPSKFTKAGQEYRSLANLQREAEAKKADPGFRSDMEALFLGGRNAG